MFSRAFGLTLSFSVLALFMGADHVLAQGQGQGPPSLPPGLHDRPLPPGKPFDQGGFDPPGHRSAALTDDLPEAVRVTLERLLPRVGLGQAAHLQAAVEAFNAHVDGASETVLRDPPPGFVAARSLLAAHLEVAGVDPAGSARQAPASATSASSELGAVEEEDGGSGAQADPAAAFPAPLASPASPAATDELRDRYRLSLSGAPGVPVSHRWTHPGVAANTPVGFGAAMGEVWMAASYQARARHSDGQTGAVGAGFGLGDAERWVALQVGVSSFSTVSSGFGNRGGVDLHLHRALPAGFGVALGWESAYHWGGAKRDSGSNRYAVVSRWLSLRADPGAAFGSATLSVGLGDGRFQSERAFAEGRDGWGVFGSASVRVAPPVSLIAEWTGQDVMLATSVTPLREHRLALTGGLMDVTGTAGDGARFVVGASLAHEFGR